MASILRNKESAQPDAIIGTPFIGAAIPVFLEIFCANGVVLQLRGDVHRNNFEIVDQFNRSYGTIRREYSIVRRKYAIDTVDTIGVNYAYVVIATSVVLDRLWVHDGGKRPVKDKPETRKTKRR